MPGKTLVHVFQRWRHLVFAFPNHLNVPPLQQRVICEGKGMVGSPAELAGTTPMRPNPHSESSGVPYSWLPFDAPTLFRPGSNIGAQTSVLGQ